MVSSPSGPGVLDGVEVLALSWGIAGPMATMMLADNGADVTRIERPGGDPFAGQSGYTVWQRGKRRASLDLHDPAHRDEFLALAAGGAAGGGPLPPPRPPRPGGGHAPPSPLQ